MTYFDKEMLAKASKFPYNKFIRPLAKKGTVRNLTAS